MLILDVKNIRKYIGDRKLFEVKDLSVYDGEIIGIIGRNGVGKTTFLNVLAGVDREIEGKVLLYGKMFFIRQLERRQVTDVPEHLRKKYGIRGNDPNNYSGGECSRFVMAGMETAGADLLLADEPSNHLDMEGRNLLLEKLKYFNGAVVLIDHDRHLLDNVCTRILEIEDGEVTEYAGNYSFYKKMKEQKLAGQWENYYGYVNERQHLEDSICKVNKKASSIRKAPARMGNSEARLHVMQSRQKQGKVSSSIKGITTRLEKLENVEKPRLSENIRLPDKGVPDIYAGYALSVKDLNISFSGRSILSGVSFQLLPGASAALTGPNGCGKTSLLEAIIRQEKGVEIAYRAKIGYMSQELRELDLDKSVMDNVLTAASCTQHEAREVLARLLFRRDDVLKLGKVLSGGERVRLSLARLLVSDANFLLLDEPTNYLDVPSLDALQGLLAEYAGTLIFVTHDRMFIDAVADTVIAIEDGQLVKYMGNYSEYLDWRQQKKTVAGDSLLSLEIRRDALIGKLCLLKIDDVRRKSLEEEISIIETELSQYK